ncbi:MAG TPA: AAA family ATPase [Aliidongia sp.]|nr:AAA family ATPase [Aliidongia sp.]
MSLRNNPKIMADLKAKIDETKGNRDTRKYDAGEIAAKIKSRVIGQDTIADTISSLVARKAARRTRKGTLANVLVSGPPGTGKTEMAKAISEAIFGSEEYMLNISCNSIGTSETGLSALVGAPKVYSNSSRGSIIEYLIKNKGEGVILFDEFEKAAPNKDAPVAKMLLTLLDEGKIQSQYDMNVYEAKGCIVILTSNLKQEELGKLSQQVKDPEELEQACKRVLMDALAPEFFDRVDLVTTTAPLDDEARSQILLMHFERVAKAHEVEVVDVDASFYDLLMLGVEKFKETSARTVMRWLEKVADEAFIDAVNENHWQRVVAGWDGRQIVLTEAGPEEEQE